MTCGRAGTYRHDSLRLDGHGHSKDLGPNDPPLAEVVHMPLLRRKEERAKRVTRWCARARSRRRVSFALGASNGPPQKTPAITHLAGVHRRDCTVGMVQIQAYQAAKLNGKAVEIRVAPCALQDDGRNSFPGGAYPQQILTRQYGYAGRADEREQREHQPVQRARALPQVRAQARALPCLQLKCALVGNQIEREPHRTSNISCANFLAIF